MKHKVTIRKEGGEFVVKANGDLISGPFESRAEAQKDKKAFEAELTEMGSQPEVEA